MKSKRLLSADHVLAPELRREFPGPRAPERIPGGHERGRPPSRRSICRAAGTALLCIVLAAGCGEKDSDESPAVLTVGGTAFRLDEFEKAFWEHQREKGVPADTSALAAFVPVFADRALIDVLAHVEMPELPSGPAERLEDIRERAMIDALHRREFGEAFKVPRQTLERAYERLGRRLKLRYIFVNELEEAEQIKNALMQGAAFSPIAQLQSRDDRSRDKGGDLGWVDYYDLPPVVRDKVFSLPVDGLGGPFPWSGGYQIFRVDEEIPNPARGTLEAERTRLEAEIRAVAVSDAKKVFEENLLRKYRYRTDPIEVTWMTAFLREKTSAVRRIGDPGLETADELSRSSSRVPWTSNPIPEADRERVLATMSMPDGDITPVLVLDQLITRPSIGWPRFEDNRDVEELLRQVALIWLEPRDAMTQGLDKDPQVIREVREREREIRTRVFLRSEVRSRAQATEEDALAHYQANLDKYEEPELRRFVAVGSSEWDNAVQASRLLRSGLSVEEIRTRLAPGDPSLQAVGGRGTPLLAHGQSPALDDVLFRLPLNGVSDPIPVGRSFTVAKVLEIRPAGPKPFEEVRSEIQTELTETRADSLLQALLDSRRDEFPVEIHWDTVMQARLMDPGS